MVAGPLDMDLSRIEDYDIATIDDMLQVLDTTELPPGRFATPTA